MQQLGQGLLLQAAPAVGLAARQDRHKGHTVGSGGLGVAHGVTDHHDLAALVPAGQHCGDGVCLAADLLPEDDIRMTGQPVALPLAGNGALVRGTDDGHIGHGVQLAQAFLHAGERLKRRLQRLNTAVAGVVPLLQLAQGQAAGLLQLPLQAGRGKLRRGIDPGGNILAARDLDAAVFQPVKHQPDALKPGDAAGDRVQVDLIPRGSDEIRVVIQRKHADELGAHDGGMLDAHRVHHAAVGIHANQKFTFLGKIRQCICHKNRLPLSTLPINSI